MRKKSIFQFFNFETPSTQSTKRNASSNYYSRTKRAQTEHNAPEVSHFEPRKKQNREALLPQTHQEYVKAKREIEKTFQYQQRRRQRTTQNDIPIDLKMAFIIKRQTVTGRKILHKSSFEESISSPVNKQRLESINEEVFQLQPITKEPDLVQESLGQVQLHSDWEKRWELLFETFFEMQSMKQKNISHNNDQQRKDSRVKYNRGFLSTDGENAKKLNYIEVIMLRREFQKPPTLRDTQKLEPIFMKNRIFSKLNEITRKLIIQSSKLRECEPDELLLSNDYNSDKVFVIFQGSCKVVMTTFTKDEQILGSMVIRSIYDGYHISIDNLLIEKKIDDIKKIENLQEANLQQFVKSEIYAQEKSLFIEISLEIYDEVLTYAIDEEMKEKINLLKRIRIINCNNDLRPLAAILQCQKFKFGDVIISAGQEIKHFYFIKTGRVKVAICTRKQSEIDEQKSNQIEFYDIQPNEYLNSSKNIDHCGKIIKQVKKDKKIIEMNVHIDLKNLEVGEFFGCSSLMSLQEIIKINKYKKDKIAKVTLIGLTPIVELYSIDSMEFETIPDGFQHQLRDLCLTQCEFDDYNVDQIIEQHNRWSQIKKDYFSNTVKQ